MNETMNKFKRLLSPSSKESSNNEPDVQSPEKSRPRLSDDMASAVADAVNETLTDQTVAANNLGTAVADEVSIAKISSAVITAVIPVITEAIEKGIKNALEQVMSKERAEISRLNDELLNQAWKNDANEQYTRRENIRIVNPQKGSAEGDDSADDTNKTVIDLCGKMGVTITDVDISTSHWLPGPKPMIIAKFVRRDTKRKIMMNKSKLGKKGPMIYEDLTKARLHLLREVRKTRGVEKAFTRDGVIHCILRWDDREESKVTIKTPHDLVDLGWTDDDIRQTYPIFK